MSSALSRSIFAVGTVVALLAICTQAPAQVAVRILDDLEVRGVIATPSGGDTHTTNTIAKQASSEIWLGTSGGLYVVNERTNEMTKVLGAPSDIRSLFLLSGSVWACSTDFICRVDPNDRNVEMVPFSEVVVDMAALEDVVWFVTNQGVYRFRGKAEPQRVTCQSNDIRCAKVMPDRQIWIGTKEGIYVGQNEKSAVDMLPGSPKEILCMESVAARLWVGTLGGVFRRNSEGSFSLLDNSPKGTRGIQELNGKPLFIAGNRTYTVGQDFVNGKATGKDTAVTIKLAKGEIRTFQSGTTTMGSPQSTRARTALSSDVVTDPQFTYSQEYWIGTTIGMYLYQKPANHEDPEPRRIPDIDLSVGTVKLVNGRLWLGTNKGAYRIDSNVSVSVDIQSEESLWPTVIEKLFPKVVRVSGTIRPVVQYTTLEGVPLADTDQYDREPKIIIEMNQTDFYKALAPDRSADEYRLPRNAWKPMDAGTGWVYYSVRDKLGNTFAGTIRTFVIPGPLATSGLLILAWLSSFILIFTFAPWSLVCHMILMNRQIRRYGYFNLAHIIITVVRPVRRHMLRRYLKGVQADKSLSEWRERFVLPSEDFLPARCLELVQEHRKLLLLGQSGIGKTSYFRYLISSYSSQAPPGIRLGNLVPVFIPLGRFRGSNPSQMVHTQLASYGQLTDEEITTSCLENGGILIFLDGLNEIDSTTRDLVNTFVERYWVMNYFVISSQEDYPEFAGKRIYLAALDPGRVKELLRRRLGDERANSLSSELTSEAYTIYRIPLDLELAIELLTADPDGQLPRSRRELYERTLQPIWDKAQLIGHSEYSELLISRAYEMLRSSDPSFDPPDSKMKIEIRNDLVQHRLLVARGGRYYFPHDEIGAFLAAKYFVPRFRDLLPTEAIDFTWLPMLRFAISYLREDKRDIRDLFFCLVERNKFLAIELFKWLRTVEPDLLKGWTSGFKRRLGSAMID